MANDERPPVWIGHVSLDVSDVPRASAFYESIGMRPIASGDGFSVLELRGGTHAVLHRVEEVKADEQAPFDLMVDDIDAAHDQWAELGYSPSEISRGHIHDSFTMRDPDGYVVTINSSHVGDLPV